MLKPLKPEEVRFEPASVVDPVGFVFHLDGRVFRAIAPGFVPHVRETIGLARRHDWFEAGLVDTREAEFTFPGSSMVIEHRRIPFNTVRGEWSAEGLRAAAICILRLQERLIRAGYCLKDAHPWNVLFDGARPCFIDWGSIRPVRELNVPFWYGEFRRYVLAPLYAFAIGEARIARAMLREHKVGVGNEIIERPGLAELPEHPRILFESAADRVSPEPFAQLRAYVEGLEFAEVDGHWSAYVQPAFGGESSLAELREKDRIVYRLLEEDPGETMIDIGTNKGLHSEMGASLGKRMLACDIEENCLNALFLRTRTSGSSILPLFHDFLWPIGASGLLNAIPSAEERLSCDSMLMMAVTHHLAFRSGVSFEAMARGIDRLARRRALVEFVPPDDVHVAAWSPERLPWYQLDNFLAAMKRYFPTYSIVDSDPSPRRIVVFER